MAKKVSVQFEEVVVPDVTVSAEKSLAPSIVIPKIPVICFSNDSKQSKLMLAELEENVEVEVIKVIHDNLENISEAVKGLENLKYATAYLPLSNDDLCANGSKLLREISSLNDKYTVRAYFADHEKQTIESKCKTREIE